MRALDFIVTTLYTVVDVSSPFFIQFHLNLKPLFIVYWLILKLLYIERQTINFKAEIETENL